MAWGICSFCPQIQDSSSHACPFWDSLQWVLSGIFFEWFKISWNFEMSTGSGPFHHTWISSGCGFLQHLRLFTFVWVQNAVDYQTQSWLGRYEFHTTTQFINYAGKRNPDLLKTHNIGHHFLSTKAARIVGCHLIAKFSPEFSNFADFLHFSWLGPQPHLNSQKMLYFLDKSFLGKYELTFPQGHGLKLWIMYGCTDWSHLNPPHV